MKTYTFKLGIRRSPKDRLYYIRMIAGNREIVMHSDGHKNRADCIELVARIRGGKVW